MFKAFFGALWGRALGVSPFPWHAKTYDRWVFIHDANGKPVAKVFGTTREARALAEFIIAACEEKSKVTAQ